MNIRDFDAFPSTALVVEATCTLTDRRVLFIKIEGVWTFGRSSGVPEHRLTRAEFECDLWEWDAIYAEGAAGPAKWPQPRTVYET